MPRMMTCSLICTAAAGFLGGWLAHAGSPLVASAEPPPAPALTMAGRLGANLYQQTSAEYQACCVQIYHCASERLESLLANAPRPGRPAVVMDLDETVLDNSAFQTYLYKTHQEYSEPVWLMYEEKHSQDIGLVPGAKEFIANAQKLRVNVIYISNRSELFRNATATALNRLGIGVPPEQLILKPAGGSSDKSVRRQTVAASYNILLYFGDNLRDFSEVFAGRKLPPTAAPEQCRTAIQERFDRSDAAWMHWGVDWFVLPNAVYGEWDRIIGRDPMALLRPTTMNGAPR